MAELANYRTYIETLIQEYSRYRPKYGDIDVQICCDREHNHYQLINVGWEGDKRIDGAVLHLDLKEGKIWIQHDGTEPGIADELVAMGVPKEDIVLGFQPPYKRQYTGFAVA